MKILALVFDKHYCFIHYTDYCVCIGNYTDCYVGIGYWLLCRYWLLTAMSILVTDCHVSIWNYIDCYVSIWKYSDCYVYPRLYWLLCLYLIFWRQFYLLNCRVIWILSDSESLKSHLTSFLIRYDLYGNFTLLNCRVDWYES